MFIIYYMASYIGEFFGSVSFSLQIVLWAFVYYSTLFVTIPNIVDDKSLRIILFLIHSFLMSSVVRSEYLIKITDPYLHNDDIKRLIQLETEKVVPLAKNKEALDSNLSLEEQNRQIHEQSKIIEQHNSANCDKISSFCRKCDNVCYLFDKHCSICGKCVVRFDHHCFILNACVGERNRRFFISFIFLALIQVIVFTTLNSIILHQYYKEFIEFRHSSTLNSNQINLIDYILIFTKFPLRPFISLLLSGAALIGLLFLNIKYFRLISNNLTATESKYSIKNPELPKLKISGSFQRFFHYLRIEFKDQSPFNIFWLD